MAAGACKMKLVHDVFFSLNQNADLTFTVHISYLEIYNDSGYDLLDPKHDAAKLEDLP